MEETLALFFGRLIMGNPKFEPFPGSWPGRRWLVSLLFGMGYQHIPEAINIRVEEAVHFFMVVYTLHIYLPVVEVHSTWSIIRDFGHNDDFVILELEFSGFLRDPWWFLKRS
jgi:hypothetical protein